MTTKKMMVCIDTTSGYEDKLTNGKTYEVSDDCERLFRLTDDNGRLSFAYKSRFRKPADNPAPPSIDPFISRGYSVQPAANGGFVVHRDRGRVGELNEIAAFSSATDLLVWLTKAHGVAA